MVSLNEREVPLRNKKNVRIVHDKVSRATTTVEWEEVPQGTQRTFPCEQRIENGIMSCCVQDGVIS